MKERWETLCFGDSAKQPSHPVSLHNGQRLGESSATLPSVMTDIPGGWVSVENTTRPRGSEDDEQQRIMHREHVIWTRWGKLSHPFEIRRVFQQYWLCANGIFGKKRGGWGKQQTEEQNFEASTDKKTKKLSLKTNKPKRGSGDVVDTQEAQTSRVKSLRCLFSARNDERPLQNRGKGSNFRSVG